MAERRRFIHVGRSVYAKTALTTDRCLDAVNVILDKPDCEFFVRWYGFALSGAQAVRLEIYDDAWAVFREIPEFAELFAEYTSDNQHVKLTPQKFCEELVSMGFEDVTKTEF